ncbi:MAG: ATP-binding protein [Bacteroidota bacterium]
MTKEERINTISLDFDLLFQSLPDACIIKDMSCHWLAYNKKAQSLFTLPPKLAVHNDFELFSSEVARQIQEYDRVAFASDHSTPQIISWSINEQDQQLLQIKRSKILLNDTAYLLCQIQKLELAENHPEIYRVLELIKHTLANHTQESFLERIVRGIAKTLDVEYVMICTLDRDAYQLSSQAFWMKDRLGTHSYSISETPCEKLINTTESLCIVANAAKLYPKDKDLEDLSIEGYLGVPLFNSTQQLIGHLVIMDTKPLSRVAMAQTVMQIYSSRIAAELERNQKEELLRLAEQENQLILEAKVKELDEKNQQLQQYIDSNLQLENFAYVASHDLKEPLRTIGNFSQLLKRRYTDILDQDGKEFLDFIISGVSDMSQLIEGLLEFARVNSQDAEKEHINPNDLINSVLDSLQQVIKESKALITVESMPQHIYANPVQLKQVYLNLISNAIKFRKPDLAPRIVLRSQENESTWQFCVSDNGEGIRQDFYDTIFMLFRKLHSRHDHQGSGIGLAICKEIVSQHGGKIWLSSTEGEGTTFYFTLAK